MKTVAVEQAQLESCVADAQRERIVLTKTGTPVALLIGLDEEQQELGGSGEFWSMIAERRQQPTLSRAELERRLEVKDSSSGNST